MLNKEIYEMIQIKINNNELCVEDLQILNNDFLNECSILYIHNKQREIENEISFGKRFKNLFKKCIKDYFSFQIGNFYGTLKCLEVLLCSNKRQTKFNELMIASYEKSGVSNILNYLYEHPDSQHKVICESLHMSKSYLSQLLRELERAGCVERYATGKRSFFSLSVLGQDFVRKKKNENKALADIYNYKFGRKDNKYDIFSGSRPTINTLPGMFQRSEFKPKYFSGPEKLELVNTKEEAYAGKY